MDYQEVIERFKTGYLVDSNGDTTQKDFEALRIAISTMQELQEYHKTGLSPKHVADTICELSATKRVLGHYQQLGTLEEFREAVEKQEEERPQKMLGIFGGEEYECRECGNTVEYMDEYCRWCGKKQDWE